jgi:pullulanase
MMQRSDGRHAGAVFAIDYKVDAFRFDLMGHHLKANMLSSAKAALQTLNLGAARRRRLEAPTCTARGGTSAKSLNNARGANATQFEHVLARGVGTFNDRIRDGIRGGGGFDSKQRAFARTKGFATGLYLDPNEADSTRPRSSETSWTS